MNFKKSPKKIISLIQKKFLGKIAIRSSASDEDTEIKSNAGKYKSFINVNSKNYFEIEKCINLVIESYKSKNRNNIFLYKKW